MAKRTSQPTRNNGIARVLRTPLFRPRVVTDKKKKKQKEFCRKGKDD